MECDASPSTQASGDSLISENRGFKSLSKAAENYKPLSNVVDKPPVDDSEIVSISWENDSEVTSQITKTPLFQDADKSIPLDAFVLENVLTKNECEELIAATARVGYTYWVNGNDRREDYRKVDTIECYSTKLAARIFGRIRRFIIPEFTIPDNETDERYEVDVVGKWVADHLNPLQLFGRYEGGGHFAPHTDGTTIEDINSRTFYTALIYMRSTGGGGETRILSNDMKGQDLPRNEAGICTARADQILAAVDPAPGRMLVFFHDQMHEGAPVNEGREKYIWRTDIFYRRTPAILTEVNDVEAYKIWSQAQYAAEQGDAFAAADMFKSAIRLSPGLRELYRM